VPNVPLTPAGAVTGPVTGGQYTAHDPLHTDLVAVSGALGVRKPDAEIFRIAAEGARIVSVSSSAHHRSPVVFDDIHFEHREYEPWSAYGQSKTANVLFAVEFDRRHKARGVRATALHPGGIHTELGRHMTPEILQQLVASANASEPAGAPAFNWKTIPQGAATSVWAGVVAPAAEVAARYCEDCHVAEVVEGGGRTGVRAYALDPERAKALWAKSEEMVGETF